MQPWVFYGYRINESILHVLIDFVELTVEQITGIITCLLCISHFCASKICSNLGSDNHSILLFLNSHCWVTLLSLLSLRLMDEFLAYGWCLDLACNRCCWIIRRSPLLGQCIHLPAAVALAANDAHLYPSPEDHSWLTATAPATYKSEI